MKDLLPWKGGGIKGRRDSMSSMREEIVGTDFELEIQDRRHLRRRREGTRRGRGRGKRRGRGREERRVYNKYMRTEQQRAVHGYYFSASIDIFYFQTPK
jgi:hypothetical protein